MEKQFNRSWTRFYDDPRTILLNPAMAAVREVGVNFKNPHSVFPTFTTANASAMATGHQLGDTGNYSNIRPDNERCIRLGGDCRTARLIVTNGARGRAHYV
jgi:hypothetical protein